MIDQVERALDNTTDVETPERIRFQHRVAGPTRRGLAWLLDLLIKAFVLFMVMLLGTVTLNLGLRDKAGNASQGLMLVALFVLDWIYGVMFEASWNGQTPGKRALSIRVVKEGGFPITFTDALLRNLLRAADFLPLGYALGLLVMAVDARFRRLGDWVAGTVVVIEDAAMVTAPFVLVRPPSPDELSRLPSRVPLSAEETTAIELFLRRPTLAPARRTELAEMVIPILAARLGIAPRDVGDPVRFLELVYTRAMGTGPQAPAVAA